MQRRHFLTIATSAVIAASAPTAHAATLMLSEIESKIAQGGAVFIHVTAPWCGTCKRQKPIVADLLNRPEFKTLTKIDVDFDSQRDVLQKFKVQTQTTMLLFKGGQEIDRAVGETDPEAIAAFLRKAV